MFIFDFGVNCPFKGIAQREPFAVLLRVKWADWYFMNVWQVITAH